MTRPKPDLHRLREQNQALEEAVIERTQLLMRAKRAWEATFDAMVDPLAIMNAELCIVRGNLAHAAAADKDVRTVNGQRCYETLFGREQPCVGCPASQTLKTGKAADGEVEDRQRGRIYRVWSFPKASDSEGSDVVCHYKDITEERELQRRLLQNDKMAAVGTLAGGVAHEINNPLGAIMAFAQLGLNDCESGTLLHDFLTEIDQSARRCKRIVASLLDFSRPSRGERRPVELSEVCEQAIFLCKTQFGREPATLLTQYDESVPAILGDRNQIYQVIVNLLSNAYGAMEGKAGKIRVGTRVTPDREIRLFVSDEGTGIEPRYLAKIFEPFFTTKPEGEGTGLGLSITYSIVQDHGGQIEVNSVVGKGTQFELVFPWPEGGETL